MPIDPYDPQNGYKNPLEGVKPIPSPPISDFEFELVGVGGRPLEPGQIARPIEKPIPRPASPFELIYDFRPDRGATRWVYPTVTQRIPAPRPVLSPIGSLTGSILYNNVNYASQPKLKPVSN